MKLWTAFLAMALLGGATADRSFASFPFSDLEENPKYEGNLGVERPVVHSRLPLSFFEDHHHIGTVNTTAVPRSMVTIGEAIKAGTKAKSEYLYDNKTIPEVRYHMRKKS